VSKRRGAKVDSGDFGGESGSEGYFGRGGWWVLGQSVLMVGVVLAGVLAGGDWHSPMFFCMGWGLLAFGGLVGVVGVVHLGRARTAYPVPKAGVRLVTHGIYSCVRHPLYMSLVLSAVGWGLIWSSGTVLGVTGVLVLFLDAKARREERWLRAVYGEEYERYTRGVRRWVPGVY
jgi:protein-S-isoprenylcysteine O-methyltransferase Ste14